MAGLRDDEVRRLLTHLRRRIGDSGALAQVEDELRGEYAAEYLREPGVLAYFPALEEELGTSGGRWQLRVIPHAHLRMVQRGVGLPEVMKIFGRFVERCAGRGELIIPGPHTILSNQGSRRGPLTLRID